MAEHKSKYQWSSTFKNSDDAEEAMFDSYNEGELHRSDSPEVKAVKDHRGRVEGYAIFKTEIHYY